MKKFFFLVILIFPQFVNASTSYEQCRNHFLHGRYFMAEEPCLAAANMGNLDAQKWLAFLYTKGKGVQQDHKKAFFWRKKAAKSGDINSQYHLGRFLELGDGVEKDLEKARYWYEKSANKGDMNGLYAMGNLYRKGIGVTVDLPKAYAWYSLAAAKNMVLAQEAVERMEKTMDDQQLTKSRELMNTFTGK